MKKWTSLALLGLTSATLLVACGSKKEENSSSVKETFWLGIDTPYALHHPKMSPNEAALPFAVENIGKFLKMKANQ